MPKGKKLDKTLKFKYKRYCSPHLKYNEISPINDISLLIKRNFAIFHRYSLFKENILYVDQSL